MICRVVENRRKVIISTGTAKRRVYVVEQFFLPAVCRTVTAGRFYATADREIRSSDRKSCQPSCFP